ncbi:hypothetical protein EV426DRAFT_335415 [Tirmania nivea]|nr:hypothetical protein EV426DRAFT_335415 [Tirmania nivea]
MFCDGFIATSKRGWVVGLFFVFILLWLALGFLSFFCARLILIYVAAVLRQYPNLCCFVLSLFI